MAFRDTAQGLLGGLHRFSNAASGLLFPGMEATGVDPRIAQAAKAQAMMQMGAGLLGGQNFGQAYGLGQQAGYEPIEQARREAAMRAAAANQQAEADYRKWQMGRAEKQDVLTAEEQQREIRRDNRRDMRARFADQAEQERWNKDYELRQQQAARAGRVDAPAEQRFAEWYMGLPDDKKAEVDRLRGTGAEKPLTDTQATATGYLGRMQAAEKKLSSFGAPSVKDYWAMESLINGGPSAGMFANAALSEGGQQLLQAQSDWVRAKLRKESGAVISPQEMVQEIRTYFPMPMDGKDVIEQKRQARRQAEEQMRISSGPGSAREQNRTADPLGLFN